jgi:hypothetical protein
MVTTYAFIITCLSYFVVRGVIEGMVMIQPRDAMHENGLEGGPRAHIWFGAYHVFTVGRDILLIAAVWEASRWTCALSALPGVLLLGWELTAILYSTTRYALLWPAQENVLGTGIRISGSNLTLLHTFRIAMGILLLAILI